VQIITSNILETIKLKNYSVMGNKYKVKFKSISKLHANSNTFPAKAKRFRFRVQQM